MTEAGRDRTDQPSEEENQNGGDSRQQQRPARTARTNPASKEKGKLRQSRETRDRSANGGDQMRTRGKEQNQERSDKQNQQSTRKRKCAR